MKMYYFEGTADEISTVFGTLKSGTSVTPQAPNEEAVAFPAAKAEDEEVEETRFVEMSVARRVLTRRPLSTEVIGILKKLYERGEEWTSRDEMCEVSGYSRAQLAGLLGAFGRRVSHTEGYEEGAHFFDYEWDPEARAWSYRLPQAVREALEAESLI